MKEENVLINLNNENNKNNLNVSEYYSAQSEPIVIEIVKKEKKIFNINQNQNFNDNILISSSNSSNIYDLNSLDSFESLQEENINLENDLTQIRESLINKDYEKKREIERKIVQKEICMRKNENNKRLQKLKNLEEKLISHANPILEEENNMMNQLNNNQDKKIKLCLINKNKGEGFYIQTIEEVENNFNEHKFCDYIFYAKK